MKQAIDFDSQLNAVPVRNEKVALAPSEHDPEVLIVTVQLRYKGLMSLARTLANPRPYKKYMLAGLTRELYERLDGKRTVEDLIEEFAESEKLTFFESRALVLEYLKGLMKRGLIVVVGRDDD